MRFKGILFDLGNTLLHFDGDVAEMVARADQALAASLVGSGLALDKNRFAQEFRHRLSTYHLEREVDYIERTTRRILEQVLAAFGFSDVPDPILEEGLKKLYFVSQSHWIPEQDTRPTLQALQQRGYRLGIISNAGDDADVQLLVDKAGIRPHFDFILTSAAIGCRKPDPSIFEYALEQWGIAPAEAVMVGDTLHADVLGANQIGIFSVWITRRADRPDNRATRAKITPDATIATLEELPALIDQLKDAAEA